MDLATIEYKHWNERDLEAPALIEFIKAHPDIKTALDVGAHWSWSYYAPEVRKLLQRYDAVDILPDPQTKEIVDHYVTGNVLKMLPIIKEDPYYDLVFCISSIEHAGITTYKVVDYKEEQRKLFRRVVALAKKYAFITFPFGKEALHEGQFANITLEQLLQFGKIAKEKGNPFMVHRFYFSEAPQEKYPYREVDMAFASAVEYLPEKGTRCVCFLSIEKV